MCGHGILACFTKCFQCWPGGYVKYAAVLRRILGSVSMVPVDCLFFIRVSDNSLVGEAGGAGIPFLFSMLFCLSKLFFQKTFRARTPSSAPPPFLWGDNEGVGPQDSVIKRRIGEQEKNRKRRMREDKRRRIYVYIYR